MLGINLVSTFGGSLPSHGADDKSVNDLDDDGYNSCHTNNVDGFNEFPTDTEEEEDTKDDKDDPVFVCASSSESDASKKRGISKKPEPKKRGSSKKQATCKQAPCKQLQPKSSKAKLAAKRKPITIGSQS